MCRADFCNQNQLRLFRIKNRDVSKYFSCTISGKTQKKEGLFTDKRLTFCYCINNRITMSFGGQIKTQNKLQTTICTTYYRRCYQISHKKVFFVAVRTEESYFGKKSYTTIDVGLEKRDFSEPKYFDILPIFRQRTAKSI